MKLKFNTHKNRIFNLLIIAVSLPLLSFGQLGSTMYGLYRPMSPVSVSLIEIDPTTGVMTPVGNQVLSTTINITGVSLNPYELSYSYQDDNSWISLSILDGSVLSDVTVNLPSATGDFNNFRFNTADSVMYGLYSQVIYDPMTGQYDGDMRLASCDLSTGLVSLISASSVATSYTMAGAVIDPHLMVYYFISEGKLMGLDLYNGSIFTQPIITIPSGGSSFDNFAYNCGDTTMYGLIMENGVKSLGKINAATGIVTPLPTLLNLPNYIMNAATIDPLTGVYYFETMSNTGVVLMGLSLLDGSIVSSIEIPNGAFFDMFRIENDCFEAFPTRLNPAAQLANANDIAVKIAPNPAREHLTISAPQNPTQIQIFNALGQKMTGSWTSTPAQQLAIDHLDSGVYILELQFSNTAKSIRFIKE
jgi:hypothetical protein